MIKYLKYSLVIIFCASVFNLAGSSEYKKNDIDKIRLLKEDIPKGFMYGKVPRIYRKVLKSNPWLMDSKAIKKLAGKIYPGGNYARIANIHMSILANRMTPFGDDIVCYVIVFRDNVVAKNEIRKINEYAGYNSDRTILVARDNVAVFLHVDDVSNFHHIREIAASIESRLKKM